MTTKRFRFLRQAVPRYDHVGKAPHAPIIIPVCTCVCASVHSASIKHVPAHIAHPAHGCFTL